MEVSTIIINTIFYIVVTAIFIVLIVKEKAIGNWIKVRRDKFADKVVEKLGFTDMPFGKFIKKTIELVESLGTALILVIIIQHIYLGNFVVPTGSMEKTIMPGDRLFANMVEYKFTVPKREDIVVFKEPLQNKVLYTKRLMGLPGERVDIHNNHLYINGKELNEREYSDLGLLAKDGVWIVPRRGDTIEIIPGSNYGEIIKERNINIDKLQKHLLENPIDAERILPDLVFKVNGQKTGMILDMIHNKKYLKEILAGKPVKTKLKDNYFLVLGDNTNNSFDSRYWGFVKESRIKGKAFVRFWPLNRISFLD